MSIPWDASATLYSTTDDAKVHGSLREGVTAYLKLGSEQKRAALLLSDELVAIGSDPATKEIDADGLEWLAARINH